MQDKLHLQHDWLPLVGELVEIRHQDRFVRAGFVDGVTSDGSILWLAAHGAEPRSMFERSQGFSVWIEYKWESTPTHQRPHARLHSKPAA
ncbi:hypothetical protein DM794_19805 [Paenarthrobacter ureafaciens]|uniref:hypothetical protein n=1 Tax=Paenarthrobacter TaxID=1742992 RepID=UPI0015BDAD09|nr:MULTISPECIES: hypothetical protein [Paenarthrobacter]NWL29277.1 hypothetical protein [Paenarthrobacter ureafaciens]QSZ54010.1 hypothetical protein AYX19_14090 [Paenarthrobacter ureafaciens]WOC62796.1 hypothetical protein RI444_09340 [Paenarthrobacter sp. AT5]BCW84027.1 hypothetical protein NicSoilE8_17000 [Arthrobacter sp. NicSoilE8]